MRRLADCCCFFFFSSPFILLAFFPSFPPFFLKLQLSRHEGPCGPDQMFQAAAYFPTLCLMEYSWATRHRSTAPRRTDQRPLIYLFHHPAAWLSNAQQQFNMQEHLLTSLFLSEPLTTSFFLHSVAFHWHGSPGYINMPYSISVGILMDHSPSCPSFPPLLLSRS